MGTSQSSNGSPSGTSMVPPWTPDIQPGSNGEGDIPDGVIPSAEAGNEQPQEQEKVAQDPPLAPPSRFGGARRNLGNFARTGDRSGMKKGLGQYVRKGYGGSKTATRRLASTAITARAFFSALSLGGESHQTEEREALDPANLVGKNAYEVMDIIVEAVAPVDGTQDTEVSRESIKDALAEVLTTYPDADLGNLREEEREFALERFVAGDVFRRIDLDLGKSIREKAPNTSSALRRLKEIREYVRETVSAAFRKIKAVNPIISNNSVIRVVQNAIKETWEVFEGYAE